MINQLQEKYQLSLLLLLSSLAIAGVFPFVFIRFFEGNIAAALIDVALIVGMAGAVAYAHLSKNIRAVCLGLAVFLNTGVVAVAIANGFNSFLWVYPVFASTFFLVKPIEAFAANVAGAIALALLSDIFVTVSLVSFFITILMLSLSAFIYASHSEKQFELLETLNTVDDLTGALNRRAMSADIKAALSTAERHGTGQLLVILDLDHFKSVNDKFGHTAGDDALKRLVSITTSKIRAYDRLYRFGGEEFVVYMKGDDRETLIRTLERVKNAVCANSADIVPNGFTVSGGVCIVETEQNKLNFEEIFKYADEKLYVAKTMGKNRIVF